MGKLVNIADLQTGMMVVKVIEQSGPVKIRKVGMIRSPDMIKGLKEMGVSLVEVDLAQSIQMEDEQLEEIAQVSDGTVTQRLLVSDKQIADADRNLSQQFHRSLFMPAVDQMPSKWTLYGKPYVLLALVIITGFCIGWFSTVGIKTALSPPVIENQAPVELASEANKAFNTQSSVSTSSTPPRNEETKQIPNTEADQPLGARADSTSGKAGLVKTTEDNQQGQNNASELDTPQPNEGKQQIVSDSLTDNVSNMSDVATEPQSAAVPDASSSQSGLALEEGQRVLGYQGEDLEGSLQENSQNQTLNTAETSNASSAGSARNSNSVNNDLLRKIQEAAQAVDSQAQAPLPDPISVTDLNDVVRIDQLSPAILTQMPEMSFSAHMYARDPRDRWVRVNSRRLGQGDFIAEGLMLKRIEPEKVILSFKGTDFSMNALSDW